MNADNSGHSGKCCQKNESIINVVVRPIANPTRPAGIMSFIIVICLVIKRYNVCVASNRANSDRNIIPAIVSRVKESRHLFLYEYDSCGIDSGRSNPIAYVAII